MPEPRRGSAALAFQPPHQKKKFKKKGIKQWFNTDGVNKKQTYTHSKKWVVPGNLGMAGVQNRAARLGPCASIGARWPKK